MKTVGANRSTVSLPSTGPTSTTVVNGLLIKGDGNTASTAENGDSLITQNASGETVIQYRVSGAWDTSSETIIAAS